MPGFNVPPAFSTGAQTTLQSVAVVRVVCWLAPGQTE
jgi:hypothetical protein